MCGISGCINVENAELVLDKIMPFIAHRGPDGLQVYSLDERNAFGHSLLRIVDDVSQPLVGKGILVSNCEIYNWKELSEKYGYSSKNDSELLLKLLDDDKFSYDELEGVFAFAYYRDDKLILVRDLLGVKPLFYTKMSDGFIFCSEAKALEDAVEVPPGSITTFDISKGKVGSYDFQKEFFDSILSNDLDSVKLETLLVEAIKKRVPDGQKIGVLFSGGIDSTFIAYVLRKNNIEFTCYSAGFHEEGLKYPEDLEWSKNVAEELGFNSVLDCVGSDSVQSVIHEVTDIIESNNVVKIGVALPFYFALQKAKEDGVRVIFSGLGSEEIFAGYQRHEQSDNINEECVSGLKKMHERDLYRDDLISMFFGIEMRLPFLDINLVKYSLGLPESIKIKDGIKKYILREIALNLGMPKEIAFRPKRAAQYGSRFDVALGKLAKKHGFSKKSDYLKSVNPKEMFNN